MTYRNLSALLHKNCQKKQETVKVLLKKRSIQLSSRHLHPSRGYETKSRLIFPFTGVSSVLILLVCLIAGATTAITLHAETLVPVKVQKGSNLIHLARDYCTTRDVWVEIARINNIKPPYVIAEDQTINIPFSLLITEGLSARVEYVSGTVLKHWRNGQKRSVFKGDMLSTGQSITTGKDGYAQLSFPDNKFTRVESDSKLTVTSLFRLVDGATKAELFLEKGRVVHDVKKKLGDNDIFNTRTAVSITGIRGTTFRMKMADSTTNVVETLAGKVNLKNDNNQQIVLMQGEGSIVSKGEAPRPAKSLPQPPKMPALDPVYKTLPITITLDSSTSDRGVRLRVTKDRDGQNSVFEQKASPGEMLWIPSLEDGSYHVLLTTLDDEGFESRPTEPVMLQVRTNPAAPFITSPQNNITSWKKSMEINWLQIHQAEKYFAELAREDEFTSLLESGYLEETEFVTPDLAAGTYYFRVRSIAADGFASNYSQPIQFTVVDQPSMEAIDTSSPDNIHLQWPEIGPNCSYDLEIATNKNFSSVYLNKTGLTDNQFTLQEKVPHGTYYVRIRATLENGLQSKWTNPQKMVIEYKSSGWEYLIVYLFLLAVII